MLAGNSSVGLSFVTDYDYSVAGKRVKFRGRMARVTAYVGDGRFEILDHNDDKRWVHRKGLVFTR